MVKPLCYQTSHTGLISRGSSCQQTCLSPRAARATQPSILHRSLNAYRIIPRLTPGQRRWGFINHHWWYDRRLSTCNLMSADHTQVDWSTEPRGSGRVVTLVREVFIWEKTSRLQSGQPSELVSWDDFNFCLHEKFPTGLQGWMCHVTLFWVWFSLILITVQLSS